MSELGMRIGNDPRGRGEFVALCEELSKLNHPARPDVDWDKVERWCRELLRDSGGDLQTAAFFALALGHRRGLSGMADGVALLGQVLGGGWERLWPLRSQERTDILAWLFTQMQPLLRGLEAGDGELPAARRLEVELDALQARLGEHLQAPLAPLRALRQQLATLVGRLESSVAASSRTGRIILHMPFGGPVQTVRQVQVPSPDPATPAVVELEIAMLPTVARRGRRWLPWLSAGLVAVMLMGALWWGWPFARGNGVGVSSPDFAQAGVTGPIRLDSRLLFAAGSARLKPESTKALVNALANIKAQPGWLVVITGHTDATGDAERNLQLSRLRAEAVRDWMKSMGDVPDDCFVVQGSGSSQPIADNGSEAGRAANRRVDISLVPQKGACLTKAP
ncbi:OmpA family protein [Pseudomonas sp. Q1-7]|uniref:OmpA family protein n=1 Tax=Pseudomonas sp. Q1-7 TaxID=3020843 RepID=UPI002FE25F74